MAHVGAPVANWRWGRWGLVVLGVGLIAAPTIFQMFAAGTEGGQMMTAFKTIETSQNIKKIQGYFGSMAVGQGSIRLEVVPALEHTGLSAAEIAAKFPGVATLDATRVHSLNDMTPMIGAMSDNVVSLGRWPACRPLRSSHGSSCSPAC